MGSNSTKRYMLTLYVAGEAAARSLATAIEAILAATPDGYDLEVVDVLDAPERASAEGVFATPMLVKRSPQPVTRVLGDVEDAARVLGLLGISTDS